MSEPTSPTCRVARCHHTALEGRDVCARHAPEHLRAIAGKGGRAKAAGARATRLATAAALRAGTVAELRAALEAAMAEAYADGDWSTVVSAVRAGIELVKTGELEHEVARMLALVEQRFGGSAHGPH